MRVCQGAELSFAAALQLNPAQLARQMPGQFLEAAAALVCGLPSPLLDGAMAKLESAFEPMPSDRVKSFLLMLAQTRLRGLDDGGERIVRVLDAMNYSQSALNWVWEAVAASDACIDAAELRQLIEFEIIARNVPFSTGYALRAVGQA